MHSDTTLQYYPTCYTVINVQVEQRKCIEPRQEQHMTVLVSFQPNLSKYNMNL